MSEDKPAVHLRAVSPHFVVDDVTKAAEYYRDKLGFRILERLADLPKFALVRRDKVVFHFDQGAPPRDAGPARRPGLYSAYVLVDGVDALAEELRSRGATVIEGPVDRFYNMREVVVEDPWGHVVAFAERIEDSS